MKQRGNSIFVPLESSRRKRGLGAVTRSGKPRSSAGTGRPGILAQDPDSPRTVLPLLCDNFFIVTTSSSHFLHSFLKASKGLSAREIEKSKPFPTWPHDRGRAPVPLTCQHCSVHTASRYHELSSQQSKDVRISTQSPSNKEPACWPPPRDSEQIIS